MASSSSHVCGHENKTRRLSPTCRRRVKDPGFCYQHRVVIPSPRASVDHVNPIRTLHTVVTPAWAQTWSERLHAILGDPLHSRVRASGGTLCDDLARLAASLERAVDETQGALTDTIASTTTVSRTSGTARLVVERFVEQVTAGPADRVAAIVRGIRVCGVVLCVLDNRVESCRCLDALTASVRDDEVDAAVDAGVQRALEGGLAPFRPAVAAALPG